MYYIYILVLFIVIGYISLTSKENFSNFYKRNKDLDYISSKMKIPIKTQQNIKTNQVFPITNKKTKSIKVPVGVSSSRIPDDYSDLKNYVIPVPKFDDLVDSPIKLDTIKSKDKSSKKTINKLSKKIVDKSSKKIVDKSIKNSDSCIFVSSINNNVVTCPKNYSVYTGAKIGISNSNISCNGQKNNIKGAEAIASIKKGKVINIQIIDSGSNYTIPPSIKIIGDGVGAKAYSILKDRKISNIIIKKSGKNYKSTPIIKISKPNITTYCNLCCRNEV